MGARLTRVVCCSITAAGAGLARRLPYEHRAGHLVDTVRDEWRHTEAFVLIAATGVAVRAIAPLLQDKAIDPAVVCVDDGGRWAVALTGGHQGGANSLAREVAAVLGATAVVTTATDGAGRPGLDDLPGFRAEGDVASVTRRWLDGQPPGLTVDADLEGWPLPRYLEEVKGLPSAPSGPRLTVTDAARRPLAGEVLLRPPTVTIGVGASTGADPAGLSVLVREALADAGRSRLAVAAVATLERKQDEPAVAALAGELGVQCVPFPAPLLAEQVVPHPSPVVLDAVGTPSVAEAAALAGAGPGSELVVTKRVSAGRDSTVALAHRRRPRGHLAVVGLGPGRPSARTPEAEAAVRHADAVLGYELYLELAADLLSPGQDVRPSAIGAERDRCLEALGLAASGRRVALVCSGDPGVYAMASLVWELAAGAGDPPVTVIPGISAALAAAAVLGAPLGHDHAAISLSDLLTPWADIRRRLQAAAEGDFVVSLYNPRSQRRAGHLQEALSILARHRPSTTPAAVVGSVGRAGQRVERATVTTLDPAKADMLSIVVVGSSHTRWIGDRMVTPRGYRSEA